MWPDGICRVTDTRYTKTIQYQDINYQLSQNEDKTAIFEAWCDFLNYFDSSVQFQLSFVNLSASQETFARSISIPPCGDEFDGIRAEYAGMLQNQLARGNNGLIKTKYLTLSEIIDLYNNAVNIEWQVKTLFSDSLYAAYDLISGRHTLVIRDSLESQCFQIVK